MNFICDFFILLLFNFSLWKISYTKLHTQMQGVNSVSPHMPITQHKQPSTHG